MLSARPLLLPSILSIFAGSAAADLVLPGGQGAPDAPWKGVAAARGSAKTLAVWNPGRAFVSRDGGGRWDEVLAAPEPIGAAALADDGTLFVARGARLGRALPDGQVSWRDLPGEPDLLVAGGGAVAWAMNDREHRRLEISTDGGAAFRRHTLPIDESIEGLVIDDDGALQAAINIPCGDICGCDHVDRYLGRIGSRTWRRTTWGGHAEDAGYGPPLWELGAGGWAYFADGGREEVLHATRDGSDRSLGNFGEPYSLKVGTNGRVNLAVANGVLYRFDGARAALIDRSAPAEVDALAVDAAGRALAVAKGHLSRWTRGEGWREIEVLPPKQARR